MLFRERKTIVIKPTVDFSVRAKSAGRIKESTNKIFSDKVQAIREFESERDSREDLMYLTSAEALLNAKKNSNSEVNSPRYNSIVLC